MTDTEELAFIRRVLWVFGEVSDQHESLFWRVIDNQIKLLAMCNDLFWWATADLEEITPANLPILEQTLGDLQAMEDAVVGNRPAKKSDFPLLYLADLFAARSRKMRPQHPFLEKLDAPMLALFEACGPERDRNDEG